MAAAQGALALGTPLGAHVLGGGHVGSLPGRLRAFAGVPAVILILAAAIVLGQAGMIGWPAEAAGLLAPATWLIAGYMALSTLGNLGSRSQYGRTAFAAVTAMLAVLFAAVALS